MDDDAQPAGSCVVITFAKKGRAIQRGECRSHPSHTKSAPSSFRRVSKNGPLGKAAKGEVLRKFCSVTLVLGAIAVTPAAFAAAPQSPVGGPGAHPHHVHTGSGCRDIDAVMFEPGASGLHRGSNASGPTRGPFHGTCEEEHPHQPPGGH